MEGRQEPIANIGTSIHNVVTEMATSLACQVKPRHAATE